MTQRTITTTNNLQPLTVSAAEAARLLGVSRSTWDSWTTRGLTPRPLRIGGRVLWSYRELMAWIDAGAPPRAIWYQREGRRE